jgi:hypothetical protein
MTYRGLFVMVVFIVLFYDLTAQEALGPKYYREYPNHISARFYFSRKYTTLVFRNSEKDYALLYRPNTSLNMGIGATYKWATINLAYGFGFLNPERGRGKTKYLDLQFHSYGRKIAIDVFGQFYKGFYLSPRGTATLENKYYLRPDINVHAIGASVQYVFNYNQFSYRAAFLQNEWQQKSAGTFLLGVEMFGGSIQADSSIVPKAIDPALASTGIGKLTFVELGPSAGYAYTFVYKQHYFVTGAATVALDLGWNQVENIADRKSAFGFNPNSMFRASAGYNSESWAFNILLVSNAMRLPKFDLDNKANLRAGNLRLNIIYRFIASKKFKKYLEAIDEVEEKIE